MQHIEHYFQDFVVVEQGILVDKAVELLQTNNSRLLIAKKDGIFVGVCDSHRLLMQMSGPNQEVMFTTEYETIYDDQPLTEGQLTNPYILILNRHQTIVGWLDHTSATLQVLNQRYSQDASELTKDLEAIVDSIYDEILVVDAHGTILRISKRSALNLWGVNPDTVIGMNILDLEEKGWFKPTVTRKVLQERKKISVIQENRLGRKILAVGNPIFNKQNQLERIVIASRDITEISKLESELRNARQLTEQYKQEIDSLRRSQRIGEKTIIYQSNRMKELMEVIERIAQVESTVTIYGESGVGKELIAHAIHQLSPRCDQPFVKINCGSIPENLLESELFGYEKGAFTGALAQGKKGLFEIANNGTLFLDEVSELPLNLQVKLLRVLQEQEFMRVGGTDVIHVDVRIIAATNKKLDAMVEQGTFREDLFYRLHVIPLYVPALRERIEDIEPLVYHFLDYFNKKFSFKKHFSEDAIEMLKAYHWPGNVRQLQNVVERAMVVTNGQLITANELNQLIPKPTAPPPVQIHSIIPLQRAVELTETQLIQMALSKYKTLTKVAEVLEVSQPTISRRFQKLFQQ
jgi:PAS domain S-box-containing protein